ncbi:MAG: AAA family ATPase [Planctomycetota bacterium]
MRLVRLRLSNFWSFGPGPTFIELPDMTFLLGPNGAGKTAVLQALARMFSLDPAQRRIRRSDFHIPTDEVQNDAPGTRELWIEADFVFPELTEDDANEGDRPAVPSNFAHMQLLAEEGPAQVRFRLKATLDEDEDIEESLIYVVSEDEDGNPDQECRVSKQDRNAIQVHYLPARRDPADHVSYSANALLGRALRSANWSVEREDIITLTDQISAALTGNNAINGIGDALKQQWSCLHKGEFYADPSISFRRNEIEGLLRHLSIGFSPGHGEDAVTFERLSDGQKSLLYISLVLAMHRIGSQVLSGEMGDAFDIDKLRPAIFTLIALEEPENSLSPHYLGRVIRTLTEFAEDENGQALVATHSPSLLRRVPPELVRYLRLGHERTTVVKCIKLPANEPAAKFIREGVQTFPELYFSRLVVLGEGDSEQIVLPRLLEARGILLDDASVSVVPLGGRHVNHLWRLLNGLGIPHVTLLDLDVARYWGGWGRVRYAAQQLLKYSDISENELTQEDIDDIPDWDSEQGIIIDDYDWIDWLETCGVFFSLPLDLDFMMMMHYPEAYRVEQKELARISHQFRPRVA